MEMYYGYSYAELKAESDRCSEILELYSDLRKRPKFFPDIILEKLLRVGDTIKNIAKIDKAMIAVINAKDTMGDEAAEDTLTYLGSERGRFLVSLHDLCNVSFYEYVIFGIE